MTNTHKNEKTSAIIVITIATLILTILVPVHLRLSPYAFDDAYIHYRIANNLSQYGVPYFNPEEPIMASTSSGWTIFLALLFKLVPTNLQVLAIINALLSVAGAIIFAQLVYKLAPTPLPGWLYGFFIILYICLIFQSSTGLMETPLALLLMGLAFRLLLEKKAISASLFGAAIFFRPEFVVFSGLALLYTFRKKIFPLKITLFYTFTGVAPFLLYGFYYFGTFIPNTILAKSKLYALSYQTVVYFIVSSFIPDFSLPNFSVTIPLLWKLGYFFTLYVFIMIIVSKVVLKKDQPAFANSLVLLLFIPGSLIACLYIFARTLILPWYTPLYTVPILFGAFGTIFQKRYRDEALALTFASLPLLICLLLSSLQTIWAAIDNLPAYQRFEEGARVRKYIQVGETLFQKYPNATLLSSEIGGLGWGFRGRILDGAGLITPQALKYHPMKIPDERSSGIFGAIPVGIVDELNPEIIVSYDVFDEAFIRSVAAQRYVHFIEPNFIEEDLLLSPNGTVFGSKHLDIFIRKDTMGQ